MIEKELVESDGEAVAWAASDEVNSEEVSIVLTEEKREDFSDSDDMCSGPMIEPNFIFPDLKKKPVKRTFWPPLNEKFTFPDPADTYTSRIIAGFFMSGSFMLYILNSYDSDTKFWLFAPLAVFDFVARILFGPVPFSPFGVIATLILMLFKVEPDLHASTGKRFSACLGLTFSITLTIFHYVLDIEAKSVLCLVFALVAGMFSIGGWCIGCWFYGTFLKWRDLWYLNKVFLSFFLL